jgi:hypothetical protein
MRRSAAARSRIFGIKGRRSLAGEDDDKANGAGYPTPPPLTNERPHRNERKQHQHGGVHLYVDDKHGIAPMFARDHERVNARDVHIGLTTNGATGAT